ncbi:MAG: MYG1 family protein [Verrucomicrobiota bacterium]
MNRIITHPGSAHKDDFLACSVLIARHPTTIERRDPTEPELADPKFAVVDIGQKHQPELSNFDHHQFPRDHVPTCSLSLVLQHLNLYEDARRFCEWLEPAEWFDCRGAIDTAKYLGVERDIINKLNSPIDVSLLRAFARENTITPDTPLWQMMQLIGCNLIDYVTSMQQQLEFLRGHVQQWPIPYAGSDCKILFIEKADDLPENTRSGIGFYIDEMGWREQVIGIAYPDSRGDGYGISRFEDHQSLDFTRVKSEPDVHFAHARGFLAKTSSCDPQRLQELIKASLITHS